MDKKIRSVNYSIFKLKFLRCMHIALQRLVYFQKRKGKKGKWTYACSKSYKRHITLFLIRFSTEWYIVKN